MQDPWLWQGLIDSGVVKRRSPKNIGKVPLMFDGPGGLADREATLETFLANKVEGPAAEAFRETCDRPIGAIDRLPPALMRYLAWAAARALPMQSLENTWGARNLGFDSKMAELPPQGLTDAAELRRNIQMLHPILGSRLFQADSDFERAAREGWFPDMHDPDNFLESLHIQAHYFQVRFFPRFKWFALHAPKEEYFVIADRPVGWVAEGRINEPPACLRHPSAYVLAPISRALMLVGRHTTEPWAITPAKINVTIARWAHDWIAGPTKTTVQSALEKRRITSASSALIQ